MARGTGEGKSGVSSRRPVPACVIPVPFQHRSFPIVASMQRGVTLIEMLIAIMLAGLLAALAIPGLRALHDRLAVEAATQAILTAHTRARLVAVTERRVAVLTLTLDSIVVRAIETPTDTTPRWRGPGPAAQDVAIAGVPRSVSFAPSGVTMGIANATYVLTRGGARKQVVVSRYGRVRVQ